MRLHVEPVMFHLVPSSGFVSKLPHVNPENEVFRHEICLFPQGSDKPNRSQGFGCSFGREAVCNWPFCPLSLAIRWPYLAAVMMLSWYLGLTTMMISWGKWTSINKPPSYSFRGELIIDFIDDKMLQELLMDQLTIHLIE